MTCPHDRWIVQRIGAITGYVHVRCETCQAKGYIKEPTSEERMQAYYAPKHPYTWDGGNGRVTVIEEEK